jgi:hypothetical protein
MKKLCGLLTVLLTLTNAGSGMATETVTLPPAAVSDLSSKIFIQGNQEGPGLYAYKLVLSGVNGAARLALAPTGHYTLPNGQGVDVVQGEVVQGAVVQPGSAGTQ